MGSSRNSISFTAPATGTAPWLGLGSGIPDVSRKTSREPGSDERDTFLLSGAEDLVPIAETTRECAIAHERKGSLLASNITGMRILITGSSQQRWLDQRVRDAAQHPERSGGRANRSIEIRFSIGSSPKPKTLWEYHRYD
jgi:hypothetical protein